MRHRKSFNHLGRKEGHRKAMLANMASSLIMHKRIKTTTAKAKALRMYVEPLITKSKNDSTNSRRMVFSYLQDKNAVTELFREISPKIIDRPGGYTRILKTGNRPGDNADMCIIELVDYNQNLLAAKEEAKETGGRRRRRGSKKKETKGTEVVSEAVSGEVENITTEEVTDEKAEIAEDSTAEEQVVETKEEEQAAPQEQSEAAVEEAKTEAAEVEAKDTSDVQEEKAEEEKKEEEEGDKSKEEEKK